MFSRDQVLALMRERVHHPAGMRELLQTLKVPRDERTSFKRHVKSLVASGDLIQIRGHRFGLPEKMDLHVGRLQTHQAGYGFVLPERPLDSGGDIYVAGPHLNDAMNGDRVVARIERIKEAGGSRGGSSASLNAAARRLSAATSATTRPGASRGPAAWVTSCRSIDGC
jgi:ribonuclease R